MRLVKLMWLLVHFSTAVLKKIIIKIKNWFNSTCNLSNIYILINNHPNQTTFTLIPFNTAITNGAENES